MNVNPEILFVSKREDSASTRYRALQFFPLLREAGYEPRHVTGSGGVTAFLRMLAEARRAAIVIVLRKTWPAPLLWLLRRCARRLVFDLDDAIFCNSDGSRSRTRSKRFAAMARCCDHVFAGNGFLAQNASRFNPSVTVVPTGLQIDRYAIAAQKPAGAIELVWIGSRSTRKYLIGALPALELAAQRIPELRLKIIADFDLPRSPIPTLAVPWSTDGEARELAAAHIGIAPMRDDAWSRGKCALKVLQYMAAGLPVISSDAGANADVVLDGTTGFLAETDESWVDAITALSKDAALRARMGEEGRARARQHYSTQAVFALMQPVLAQMTDTH